MSRTTGLRVGDEGIPEGRADAEANECPKAICEHPELSKLTLNVPRIAYCQDVNFAASSEPPVESPSLYE